jgi:anti-sigma factor ChrR (cupin superfamily)
MPEEMTKGIEMRTGAPSWENQWGFARTLQEDEVLAAEWQSLDAIVADLALAAPEAVPAPAVRDHLLARVADTPQEARPVTPPTQPAAPAFTSRLAEGEWKPLAPHVHAKVLHQDRQTGLITTLIRLAPGGYLPRHRHLGFEQTLVVEGDCRVNGETFYPGDFRLRPADTEDGEVTTEHGTTILLIAPAQFECLDPHWPAALAS